MQTRHQGPKADTYPTVLSIAASDPIAGAGIQADIRACSAFGVFAMTALTAVTVQDTIGVKFVCPLDSQLVGMQLHTVCADILPRAIKIGMIPNPDVATAIADFLEKLHNLEGGLVSTPIVLDPVLAPTSGKTFASSETLDIILTQIIPHATLITPNIPEAEKIATSLGCDPTAQGLAKASRCAVLLKGGHGNKDEIEDHLALTDGYNCIFPHSRIDTSNTHGTGCTLSSAIAANLALGLDIVHAVGNATSWMQDEMIKHRHLKLGHGHGPTIF